MPALRERALLKEISITTLLSFEQKAGIVRLFVVQTNEKSNKLG